VRLIQLLCAVCGSNLAVLNPSVYSFCCVPPCVVDVGVDCAVCHQSNKRRLSCYYYLLGKDAQLCDNFHDAVVRFRGGGSLLSAIALFLYQLTRFLLRLGVTRSLGNSGTSYICADICVCYSFGAAAASSNEQLSACTPTLSCQ